MKTKNDILGKPVNYTSGKYQLISSEYRDVVDGSPIYYGSLGYQTDILLEVFSNLSGWSGKRQGKMRQKSIYTNSSPRTKGKNDYCSPSKFMMENTRGQLIVDQYTKAMSEIYEREFPEHFRKHLEQVQHKEHGICEEYVVKGTPFTSGIINKDSALNTHRDVKNLPNALSAMLVLKRRVSGGYLIMPELNLAFEMRNNTVLLFDGGKVAHGVSTITPQGKDAYRYSFVAYTMKDMFKCLPIKEEYRLANLIK